MVAPAIIAAGISAGGSLLGGLLGNKSSAKAAQEANAFTERQMKSRHQWEVQDLRKAGLNPMLSAGGAPSMGPSAKADVPYNPSEAVGSALAAKRLAAEIDLMAQERRESMAREAKTDTENAYTEELRKGVTFENVSKQSQ